MSAGQNAISTLAWYSRSLLSTSSLIVDSLRVHQSYNHEICTKGHMLIVPHRNLDNQFVCMPLDKELLWPLVEEAKWLLDGTHRIDRTATTLGRMSIRRPGTLGTQCSIPITFRLSKVMCSRDFLISLISLATPFQATEFVRY